uniref:Preprotein-translocase subunit g n=1 Tax=Caloglossa intermedia TaxID=100879 RepID=A0A1Z1M6U2_9FLOR|nr:preprotein-translocase subunit g [Caloglossa intermedia]ARW61474.1 preprotein-translocase subunit g [Caloglossa intermedia]
MIKFLLYLLSLFNIFLILFNNPASGNINNFGNQNRFLTFNSNQVFMQKIIFINVILFIAFNILYSVYT